ncbi:MAG: HD domain-containing protein [Acholeplasmatales bacterium]|jgi:(p)ppGpp synthase/HD superfamily hydrolase|nr:HD domain-containing protein [Acholeplasmatales bacterium]
MGELFNKAIEIVIKYHDGQIRKITGLPVIFHLFDAACIASSLTDDEEVWSAVLLHDILEITTYTASQLLEDFGPKVHQYVLSHTEEKIDELSRVIYWNVRKETSIMKMSSSPIQEKILVLCAELSNLRALYKDFLVLKDKVWERFTIKNSSDHKWYYSSVLQKLYEFKDTYPYVEYKRLVYLIWS